MIMLKEKKPISKSYIYLFILFFNFTIIMYIKIFKLYTVWLYSYTIIVLNINIMAKNMLAAKC